MSTFRTVLVDCASDRSLQVDLLKRLGHPVETCSGPGHDTCPILKNEPCPMLEAANAVIFELDLDLEQHREILAKYREILGPDVPIRVVLQPGQEVEYAELLRSVDVWTHEPSVAEVDGFSALIESDNE